MILLPGKVTNLYLTQIGRLPQIMFKVKIHLLFILLISDFLSGTMPFPLC